MTYNITIDHTSAHDSDQSSLTDEEDSSGVQVSPPSATGSHGYADSYDIGDEWAHLPYPDELKPSDSASRPRTSRRGRNPVHTSRSRSNRRYSRREIVPERESLSQRPRRHHSPESPGSVDSTEEYVGNYARPPADRRYWSSVVPGAVSGYANSSSSGPPYTNYPPGPIPHGAFPHAATTHTPSDQLIRFGHLGHSTRPAAFGNAAAFGYGPQFNPHHPPPVSAFFGHDHHAGAALPGHSTHSGSHSRNRSGRHSPPTAPVHGNPPFGQPPFGPSDVIPFGANGYFPYNPAYPVVPGMGPAPFFGHFAPPQRTSTPGGGSTDASKDEAIARLEKLILDERIEREAKEAAREAAIEKAAAEKAAAEERAAADQKIAEEAAAKATAIAKAEAEKKAAEEAEKAKKAAEEAAAKAAEEAAAAAAAAPPPEKKKPIKFKDAVGRKFSFPFHLCCTWQGMEELIRQAFLHVEVIGPHVAEGHYDLVGPNGDIILPQVWETAVEPDWTITMHMWPISEKPKTPDPPAADAPAPAPAPASGENSKKKADTTGSKKARAKGGDPGSFAMWMLGNNRPRAKNTKAEKKPEGS